MSWAELHDRARTPQTDFEWNAGVASREDWVARGRVLANRVQQELGDEYEVYYAEED
jgi:hypothetical protein